METNKQTARLLSYSISLFEQVGQNKQAGGQIYFAAFRPVTAVFRMRREHESSVCEATKGFALCIPTQFGICDVFVCLLACLLVCVSVLLCVCACLPACLLACLPACLLACLPAGQCIVCTRGIRIVCTRGTGSSLHAGLFCPGSFVHAVLTAMHKRVCLLGGKRGCSARRTGVSGCAPPRPAPAPTPPFPNTAPHLLHVSGYAY